MYEEHHPVIPRQVRLELTNHCNARCACCHRLSMQRPAGHMDFTLLQKCVGDIRRFPQVLTEIVLCNYGEAFLHPQWERFFRYAAASLPYTMMALPTNGSLLDDNTIAVLRTIPNLKWLNVSVNAFLPETYEAFTGLPAENMKKIEKAVLALHKLRPDITLLVSMVADSAYQSPRERELFIEHWNKLGIQAVIEPAQFNNRPDRAPAVPVSLPCRSLFLDLVVLWDGQAVSCCFVSDPDPDLVVGDALKDNLLDIWHSARFMELRKLHNSGRRREIPICSRCTFA